MKTRLIACMSLAVVALLPGMPAFAQSISIDMGDGPSLAGRSMQLIAMITLLSIVPGLAVMVTCFPFIVTVLSIMRQALGLQQAPPNMVLITLALFLTWYVMDPIFSEAWTRGPGPLSRDEMELIPAIEAAAEPFRSFMIARMNPETFTHMAELRTPDGSPLPEIAQAPFSLLIPSFLLSELARAFQIGFLIFLPFLVIDLVVSAILMSMGMMMVPPTAVSLPFKLAFFVAADGWGLLAAALVRSHG